MARCLIGCGSNHGKPRDHLADALDLLRAMPGMTVVAASRPRRSRPIGGPPGQRAFLNGAALLETQLSPDDVLGVLTAVENTLLRERAERWGPRTVDLDLLLYDGVVLDREDLTVPHPRMTTRRFVLEPCVEIAPDFVHPLAGCSLRELLDNISRPHAHIAVVGVPGSGAPEVAATVADALLARLVHAPARPPAPCDDATAYERGWQAALSECAARIQADSWPNDHHGTVTDFWLGSFLVAAEERLPADRVRRAFSHCTRGTVEPNVAILLLTDAEVLEERLAFRRRMPPPQTDMFADLTGATMAVAEPPAPGAAAAVADLVKQQERLRSLLLSRGADRGSRPKSVVVIRSDDIGQAVDEAIAAVEAMA